MEPSPPLIGKKLCNMARVAFFMIQKGVSKSKLSLHLRLLMKRGKLLGKSLNDLVIQSQSALSCRSHDVHLSFVSPRDYEFSCSDSPPYQACYVTSKRKAHFAFSKRHVRPYTPPCYDGDVEKVGPVNRRKRITDSPLRLKDDDDEDEFHVDKAAEEFIDRFYKQLRLQNWMAALELADHYG